MSVLQAALPHLQRLTQLLAKAPGGPGTRHKLQVAAKAFLSAVPGREGPGRQPPTEAEAKRFTRCGRTSLADN